ncbi:MAG: hypothetical protein SF029_16920 [bacterium]|nr:hypothetical protein [bacterium]
MTALLTRLFRLRPEEAGTVLIMGALLLTNAMATQISGVIAISGFLSEGGVNQFLLVLLIDMVVILVVTSFQSLIVDRFERVVLVRWTCLILGLVFVLLRLMFAFQLPGVLNYSLLYLVAEQQWLFFPLIFWTLAGDVFDASQAKRLFPVINSLGFVGKILGLLVAAGAAAYFSTRGLGTEELLTLNAFFYLVIYAISTPSLGQLKVRQFTPSKDESVMKTLTEGWSFVKEVPAFRFLTFAILAMSSSDIIIEFRFLVVSDAALPSANEYQTFYSLFRLGTSIVAFAIAGLVTSRLIERFTLKNSFFVLPMVMLLSAVWMIVQTGLPSAVGAFAVMWIVKDTIDESSRKAFQALVPDERRGRVSVFMDSYLLATGTIIGCVVTGIIVILGNATGSEGFFRQYLLYVAAASVFACWAIVNMRKVYDSSMFNWRLKRRQRAASVLDKLEF